MNSRTATADYVTNQFDKIMKQVDLIVADSFNENGMYRVKNGTNKKQVPKFRKNIFKNDER